MAAPPDSQLTWLFGALSDLEGFLLAPDVFRPTAGHLQRDLSLGNLLLAADAVAAGAARLSPPQRAEAARALRRWEVERSRRPVAVEGKALAELPHRMNVWSAYLQDLGRSPGEASRYPLEVRQRVVLARLLEVVAQRQEADPTRSRLKAADGALRASFEPGPFVWEAYLAAAYSREPFWFLYGRPSE